MALIKCPECGKEISDTASQCQRCACLLAVMKRFATLSSAILFVFWSSYCSAETFSIRNGISYGDSMIEVESKESLRISEKTDTTLKTVEGTIASIDKSYIVYNFSSDGKLVDIFMDFGVHIGKTEQAIAAYKTVYEALVSKYGSPASIKDDSWYVVCGSAVDEYIHNVSFLKSFGLTPSLQDKAQWILRYDDINVKIDLIRYAPNGVSAKSISSDVIISYRFFTDAEEQAAINSLNTQQQNIQDDL